MSRVAKMPVAVPQGVDVQIKEDQISVKGAGGQLSLTVNSLVKVNNEGGKLTFVPADETREANAMSGTMRQLVNNMVVGVSKGFEKKLNLVGVGFKATAQGSRLNLAVGFSHPVNKDMPAGITVATPGPTEIVVKGADRQRVGQVAAEIRAIRPPEPYKGKGIRYADEKVVIKETKKK
ncbi:50S ribosomal protein L6 [Ramlibacter sp.]|uniref:50S ribosomal protein L6 n=1 Tax=Ramlibacter sp. TaxID=1917967 RepID=UPI002D741412|nr:50S ribosomal protein L6 [Ramlibacter sp.]HYD77393.1 50S ribosomal protein L6 [Ramlibacter sp.]